MASPDTTADQLTTKSSPLTVTDAVARLTEIIASRGLKLFGVVDHSGAARAAGLERSDGDETKLTSTAPAALADRYDLSDELAARLAGIDNLTDAVID